MTQIENKSKDRLTIIFIKNDHAGVIPVEDQILDRNNLNYLTQKKLDCHFTFYKFLNDEKFKSHLYDYTHLVFHRAKTN